MAKAGYRRRFTLEVSLSELQAMRTAAKRSRMSVSAWLRTVARTAMGNLPDGGPGLLVEGRGGMVGRVGVSTFEALRKAAAEGLISKKPAKDPFEAMAAAHKAQKASS